MKRIILFLKGVCMGLADVVPGVSGGTMALILGIYTQFIDALKGLHLRWVGPLWRWLTRGRQKRDWRAFVEELSTLNLPFLLTLAAGVLTALTVGSMVIPPLLEAHPQKMRAFFFGLILASVWVPLKMISPQEYGAKLAAIVFAIILGAGFGYTVTNPSYTFELTRHWVEVESEGETLQELARRAPSAVMTDEIYWAERNDDLREAVKSVDPEHAARLDQLQPVDDEGGGVDKAEIKERAQPFNQLEVPDGVAVEVPRPAHWYIFFAGAIAISAMLLPGISGAYILLILGAYFFVLNALKGFVQTLLGGSFPVVQGGYVLLFLTGLGVGILTFARILSYLLHRFPGYTLGGLVGLMLGCLRGIWPFRETSAGVVSNVWPTTFSASVGWTILVFVVGMVIVALLTWLGSRYEEA